MLPQSLFLAAKGYYYRRRHWAHPGLKGTGTVQDLYYWVADGSLDTLLLLQNYFSVFYPMADTHTQGTITLFDDAGRELGSTTFELAPFGCVKLTVSSLLSDLGVFPGPSFGTLECHLTVPAELLRSVGPLYFFDRFYIGYTNSRAQPTFVHGVDRTHIYREDRASVKWWYGASKTHEWAPEIPVLMSDYERFSVILINRSNRRARPNLVVSDWDDQSRRWEANIESGGVHRFELTSQNTAGLAPRELRLRIKGMPTRRGRPVVFKEFRNGAISVMHC
jgi:hypothetical protein